MGQETAAVLPDVDTAFNNLFGDVHQRVFFHKLASRGYVPENQAHAEYMLKIGAILRAAEEENLVKQAEAGNDPYALALRQLEQATSAVGLDGHVKRAWQVEEDQSANAAAAQFMEDPTIYNSVLALKSAEALHYQNQLQAG